MHDGRSNTYSFLFNGVRIVLRCTPRAPASSTNNVLVVDRHAFELDFHTASYMLVVVLHVVESREWPTEVFPLIYEFSDVSSEDPP